MINSQMDNPFMIGDLVHIPKGIIFYRATYVPQSPIIDMVCDQACIGLVARKYLSDFYYVFVGEKEFLVSKEDITLITRKDKPSVTQST